jgi:hypothetical protein
MPDTVKKIIPRASQSMVFQKKIKINKQEDSKIFTSMLELV